MTNFELLAAATEPCPSTYPNLSPDESKEIGHQPECQCGGSGIVPAIPGLRVPCAPCKGSGLMPNQKTELTCLACDSPDDNDRAKPGRGYTLVGEAEALLVVLEAIPGLLRSSVVRFRRTADKRWLCSVYEGQGKGDTPLDALASAVAQALGLEVKI